MHETCDLSDFEAFVEWAEVHKDESGAIQLDKSAYDTAVELLGTDDLCCPLALVIEYKTGEGEYSLSVPFDRMSVTATSCLKAHCE
jgi:hypothetical protein